MQTLSGSNFIEGCCFPGGTSLKTWSVGLSVCCGNFLLITFCIFSIQVARDSDNNSTIVDGDKDTVRFLLHIKSYNHCQSTLGVAWPGTDAVYWRKCEEELHSAGGSEAELNCPPIPPQMAEYWPKIPTLKRQCEWGFCLDFVSPWKSPVPWVLGSESIFSFTECERQKQRKEWWRRWRWRERLWETHPVVQREHETFRQKKKTP